MRQSVSAVCLLVLLSSCGGGGGGGGSPAPSPPPSSPQPPGPPPTTFVVTLTPSTTIASYGEAISLFYSSNDAISCELRSDDPDDSNPLHAPFVSSTLNRRIYRTTTFTYRCTDRNSAATLTRTATIAVSTPALRFAASDIGVNDVAWDRNHQVMYLALGARSSVAPNSIVAFDPVTGALSGSAFAGSEPNTIAVSDDGSKLYVGFRSSNTVSRFSVPALTRDFTAPIPMNSAGTNSGHPQFALDIAAAPGAPGKFAVSLQTFARMIVYDGQSPMLAPPGQLGPEIRQPGEVLAWADSNTVLALYDFGWGATLARYDTGSVTVTPQGSTTVNNRVFGMLASDAGRIYTNCGHVIDATTLQALPSFARSCPETSPYTNAQVATDSANNRVFFAERLEEAVDASILYKIDVYREDTRELLHTARLPLSLARIPLGSKITNMIRFGADGLAMTTSDGQLLIVYGEFVAAGGTNLVRVVPGEPTGGYYRADLVQFTSVLPRAVDLAWDAQRSQLYVAVAQDAAAHAGQIAIFDPQRLDTPSYVARPTPVHAIEVTDDGQFLYVTGTDSFERLRLPTFASEALVSGVGGAWPAGFLRAAPGRPLTVAVGPVIYDDITPRGVLSGGSMQPAWGESADRFYVFDSEGSGFWIDSADTSNGGITPLWHYDNIFSSVHPFPFHTGFTQSGSLLYSDTGVVFDPEAGIVTGIFALGPLSGHGVVSVPYSMAFATPAWGPVAIDAARNRAYVASCVGYTNQDDCGLNFLQVFDTRTYAPLMISPLDVTGRVRKLIRVNEVDLAAIAFDGRVIYMPNPDSVD